MPSGSYKQADVRCPFYKFDDGKHRITCEGLIDDSSLALIYHKKMDYEIQITTSAVSITPNAKYTGC